MYKKSWGATVAHKFDDNASVCNVNEKKSIKLRTMESKVCDIIA